MKRVGLTFKQARFVAEYLIDLNGTQAAIRAGYSERTANEQACDLLARPHIAAEVERRQADVLKCAGLTTQRTLEEMRRLAFSNVRRLFDEHGNMKPLSELTDEDAACIAGLEVVKRNLTAGDGQVDTIIKVKVWDKPRVLELLGKHFALLTERTEINVTVDVVTNRLQDARRRLAG